MRTIKTIFLKELKDILRDRRTIFMMFVIPFVLMPLLLSISIKIQMSQTKKAQEKTLRVGLLSYDNAAIFRDSLLNRNDARIREDIEPDSIRPLIQQDRLDAAIILDKNFDEQVSNMNAGAMELYFKSTEDMNVTRRRLLSLIQDFERQLVSERFKRLAINENIVKAIRVQTHDIASAQERMGKTVGGFLPYIFVIFCFMGCMYPAIDLGAGEKERGTLETLLASPANRFQILTGKLGVIALAGIISAAISILGLYIMVQKMAKLPADIKDVIAGILTPHTVIMILSLLLPLTIFIAASLLSISIFAKSFREAQSIIAPLNFIIIIPIFIGIFPGIKLDAITAMIPILNVSLSTREIIAGTISIQLLAEVYASLLLLAALSLAGCAKWFEREGTLFRSA